MAGGPLLALHLISSNFTGKIFESINWSIAEVSSSGLLIPFLNFSFSLNNFRDIVKRNSKKSRRSPFNGFVCPDWKGGKKRLQKIA